MNVNKKTFREMPVSYMKRKVIDEVIKFFESEDAKIYDDDYFISCIKDVVNFSAETSSVFYYIMVNKENKK